MWRKLVCFFCTISILENRLAYRISDDICKFSLAAMYFCCIVAPPRILYTPLQCRETVIEGRPLEILKIMRGLPKFLNNNGLLFFQGNVILYFAIKRIKVTMN
jgi:hypothetical protein